MMLQLRFCPLDSARESLQNPASGSARAQNGGTSKPNWLQSNSRGASSKSLREASERGAWQPAGFPSSPRSYWTTAKTNAGKRGTDPVITSSFCGCCCCIRGLHAHICHVHCVERLLTRITDPTDPTDPTGCKQLLQNRNKSLTSCVFKTTWGKSLCSVVVSFIGT